MQSADLRLLGLDSLLQGVGKTQKAEALTHLVSTPPAGGKNAFILTHSHNIAWAYPSLNNLEDGELLIFHPQGETAQFVGRIKLSQWDTIKRLLAESAGEH